MVQGNVAVLCSGGAEAEEGQEGEKQRGRELTSRLSVLLTLLVAFRIKLGLATAGDVLKDLVSFVTGAAILDMIDVVVVVGCVVLICITQYE